MNVKMKKQGMVFVISAPSGTGKTTVIKEFLKKHGKEFIVSISATTRAPRKGEKKGRDYQFFSQRKFKNYIKKKIFFEYAKVLDNYYGTPKDAIERALKKGKNVIMDIDVQGARKIKKSLNGCVLVFIVPPSFKALERRLRKRKTDSPQDIKKRLSLAKKELKERSKYDYIIVNKELREVTEYLEYIFLLEKLKRYNIK